MKKKLLTLSLALLLLFVLTACGAKGGDNASQSAPEAGDSIASSENKMDYGWTEADVPAEEPQGVPSGGTIPENVKMIRTAFLELETQEFDAASQALSQITEELGGWFESRSLSQGGSRYLDCVVRVPSENFEAFLERAGRSAHLVSRREDGEDVSEAYYDSEARLATQRTKLERLQTLLAQAATMEDIIELENAISETELQIEYLTGSLRRYDSLVDYATVNISLWEVYRLSDDEEVPVTFGQRLAAALAFGLRSGVAGVEDFIIGLARNWMGLLVWAVVIAAAAFLFRRWQKRRKPRSAPPPPPPKQ